MVFFLNYTSWKRYCLLVERHLVRTIKRSIICAMEIALMVISCSQAGKGIVYIMSAFQLAPS